MSISKTEPEIADARTTSHFRYRDYPAEIYSGDVHGKGYGWIVYARSESTIDIGKGRSCLAEGPASNTPTRAVAMARIRAFIDGEHTRIATDDGPPF